MKTMRKLLKKNMKPVIIVAAVTAVALGGLLLLISGNEDRNQVPLDPTAEGAEAASNAEETTQAAETTNAAGASEEGVSQEAEKLFAAKVQSIGDPPAVAALLETIDLKKNVANYRVEIQAVQEPKSLNIKFNKIVGETEKDAFDKTMQQYAEQILALVTDAQEVQWTYTLKKESGVAEEVTVFLNEQQAQELLAHPVKSYGQSAQTVDVLLQKQKGI